MQFRNLHIIHINPNDYGSVEVSIVMGDPNGSLQGGAP